MKRQRRRRKTTTINGEVHYTPYGFSCETGFKPNSVYNFFKAGDLTKVKHEGRTYVSQSDLDKFRENNYFEGNEVRPEDWIGEEQKQEELELEVVAEEITVRPVTDSSNHRWNADFKRFIKVMYPEVFTKAKTFADADDTL